MFKDAADLYVSLGWVVFPLSFGSKLPAIKGGKGFKDGSSDEAKIDEWNTKFPKANIAIVTGIPSGIAVVDVDPRNGGAASMNKLAGEGLLFPQCPEARTGNGGRHLFFRLPDGLKPSKDRLGKGIDIKSTGGYVVGAPSWIAKSAQGPGGSYQWVRSPEIYSLQPLPKWALERLISKPRVLPAFDPIMSSEIANRSLEGMARRLAGSGSGTRNNLLNWCAYRAGDLVRQGKIGASLVDSRLTQAALAAGLTLPEIKATIASGLKSAMTGGNA